jgi:hypothetical protein
MAFSDKLTVVIDFVTGPAQSGLGKMRSEVKKAEGAFGKMQAAGNVAFDSVKANAANFAMAAGGALIAFGVKSVKAFQDTALAAGAFADATGLAVDEASRLIEVALGKMNKTLGASPQLFTDLGVEIAKTGTGATDVNGTFLNVVDRLNAIEDPAERARVASQLLGRGWQGMAELIGKGSAELKASLAGVGDAQVIDEKELAKARKFRDSMDELNDKLQAVTMAVGEQVVPALSAMADGFTAVGDAIDATPLDELVGFFSTGSGGWGLIQGAIDKFKESWNNVFGDGGAVDESITTIGYGTEAAAEMARIYGERATPAVDEATTHFEDLEGATARLNDTYAILKGTLDEGDALDKAAEATWNFRSETDRTEAEVRDYTRALADTVVALTEMPDEQKTNLLLKLEEGDLAAVEAALARYREGVNVPIRFKGQGSVGFEKRAMGGPVNAGQPYIVGERGPEIVVPGQSGTVIPNNRIGVGGGINVAIYPKTLPTDRELIDLVTNLRRRNGGVI